MQPQDGLTEPKCQRDLDLGGLIEAPLSLGRYPSGLNNSDINLNNKKLEEISTTPFRKPKHQALFGPQNSQMIEIFNTGLTQYMLYQSGAKDLSMSSSARVLVTLHSAISFHP